MKIRKTCSETDSLPEKSYLTTFRIKRKLAEKNIAYDFALSDLDALEEWAKELQAKRPALGSVFSDILYLQTVAIHILILSQFEYLLKTLGRIENQREMLNIFQDSTILTPLEKDHLTYLFLTRHTLVHNGGHFDEKFRQNAKSKIKKLRLEIPKESEHLSTISPSLLRLYIRLIKKVILLEITGDELSQEEKKIISNVATKV